MRDFYKTLIVGASGQGKTYTFRNLDPNTTGFINVEDKPLSFKNNFKYHKRCESYLDVYTALVEYAKNDDIKCIVVDSFSEYLDLLVKEARKTKKGFDVWSMVAEEISKFHYYIKRIQKEIFVTAHYEILNIEGAPEKRVKVKGKEHEGLIEKNYSVVLYAEREFDDENRPKYYLHLSGQGTSAKCPPEIFGEDVLKIPNDGKAILDKLIAFAS